MTDDPALFPLFRRGVDLTHFRRTFARGPPLDEGTPYQTDHHAFPHRLLRPVRHRGNGNGTRPSQRAGTL